MKKLLWLVLVAGILGCVTESSAVVENESVVDVTVAEEDRLVVSVTRFEDRSVGTEEYRPWELGIPDVVMEALGSLPYYRVISREHMMKTILAEQELQLSGVTDAQTATRIGRLLNAEYILVGSFQVFQNQLQVGAKVLSVETGEIVTQAKTQGALEQFFSVQNEIAIRITQAFSLDLPEAAQAKLRQRVETTVVEASLANYRGEDLLEQVQVLESQRKGKQAEALREKAKADFEQALSLDSEYQKARDNLAALALAVPLTL
jgi:TolB-like protein